MPVESAVIENETSVADDENFSDGVDTEYGMTDDEGPNQFADPDDTGDAGADAASESAEPPAQKPEQPVKVKATKEKAPKASKETKPAKEKKSKEVKAEPEPTETEAVAEEAAAETAAEDEFSAELLAEANRYGFTADEAREFGSAKSLERAMALMDRKSVQAVRDEYTRLEQSNAESAEKPPQAPAAKPQATEAAQAAFEKLKIELNPEEFDPDTVKVVNSLNDHYDTLVRKQHDELTALRSELERVTGRFQAEDAARFDEQMDTFFTGLGDEFRDTFGAGELSTLAENSPEAQNRLKLVEQMQALKIADQLAGRPFRGLKALQDRALRSLHFDKLKTIARKEIERKVETNRRSSVERPSGRITRPKSPEAAAGAYVKRFFDDRGESLDDGIPDEI